jgi:hypothetical protein
LVATFGGVRAMVDDLGEMFSAAATWWNSEIATTIFGESLFFYEVG